MSDRVKKKKRKIVPETSFLFDDDNDEVFGNSEKKKKKSPVSEAKTGEWLKAGKSKKSRRDPEPLDDDSPSLLKGRRKKNGVKEKDYEDEDDFVECVKPKSAEVPNRKSPRKAKASSSSAPVSTTAALPKKVKVTNKFGIQMDEEWTMSQKRRVQNMRQGKIKQFLGAKNDLKLL